MAGKALAVAAMATIFLAAAVAVAPPASGISCSDAVSALIPCGSYLLGAGGEVPSPTCCQSAQALNRAAATVGSRRALCECLKKTGPSFGVRSDRASRLPYLCKLKLNFPMSPQDMTNKHLETKKTME
ncbi:hypothetical protein HPP92_019448 [Vanilla planifolia]|uniref:Bifunctional inhibitor/plant lipid transfer protein/seed storage helical domain-containing protein n=1 Tax=Vanilla planifolia TaxID=51239 RepID=A0A835Q903_VANPL|nr:hypothetical protein HPP92_019448 [Vanilla planifolia]